MTNEERMQKAREMMAPKESERRIAIMVCKRTTGHCTGYACFCAFDRKLENFAQYAQSPVPVILWGFFHCNGCETDWSADAGMQRKLNLLKEQGVEKLHLGVCIRNNCPKLELLCRQLESYGIPYELGTH